MTPSDWRGKLGQGTRALARLLGTDSRSDPSPAPAAHPDPIDRARQLLLDGHTAEALRLGYRLLGKAGTAPQGRAVLGLCHLSAATGSQAWAQFVALDDPRLIGASCPEYAVAGFGVDPDACASRLAALVTSQPGALTGYPALVAARHAFSVGHEDLARRIDSIARDGGFGELTDYWTSEFTRLRSWFTDGFRRAPQPSVEADFRFGVLDYKQPDNSSRNVGDYIQTLASLGHLVRHSGLRFAGDDALVAAVDGLRATVKPERVRTGSAATVQLVEVQRDGNVYQRLPSPTWAVMFGWYLHPTFSGGYNLPFHDNLRPLFVSFHLNKPDALTPAAVEYLQRWGPVGCRDWQTVALLNAAGVPAFFSGCITTTVDTVFARTGPDERTGVAHIDPREPSDDDVDQIEQSVDDLRPQPFVVNLALGRQWVERYNSEFAQVVTSRLHSYLPARSVGCQVEFHPHNPSDPRFGGLIAIDDDAYEKIRQGILDKLDVMLTTLAEGASETAVYERWRELCSFDVATAEQFLGELKFGSAPLPAVELPALQDKASGERVIVVNAPRASKTLARLLVSIKAAAPDLPVIVVGTADQASARDGLHVVPAPKGQDLTLAAVLNALPDGTRVLLLNADNVLRGDPTGLFGTATSPCGLAADPDVRRNRQSLSILIRRVSARQGDDWRRALRFAAAAHRRVGHDPRVPDARVCVIDVAALRAAGWTQLAGELIGTFGARFGEALALVTKGEFALLPAATQTRLGVEPYDPGALVLQGAGASRVPLGWLSSPATTHNDGLSVE